MNHQKITSYYHFKREKDKAFFAIYCNQAQHNLYQILKVIEYLVLKTNKKGNEGSLHSNAPVIKALLKVENPETELQVQIINLLERFLPFTVVGTARQKIQKDPMLIGKRLHTFAKKLQEYRNYYSHYYTDATFPDLLRSKDFSKENEIPITLKDRDFFAFFKQVKTTSYQILNKRYRLNLLQTKNTYPQPPAFELSKEETIVVNKSIKKFNNLKENNTTETESNFLFFLSLFLTRKETFELLNHSKGKKATSTYYYKLNRELYTNYCCKPPMPKIESANPKQALLLDILNELNKCPSFIKNYLPKEAKEQLFIKQEPYTYKEDKNKATERELEGTRIIELKRYEDRFPYFTLRYIELLDKLKSFRFHVNLGEKYVKPPYTKNILGISKARELKKDILTFAHLKDISTSLYDEFKVKDETTSQVVSYEIPLHNFKPHYHFAANKIGFRKAKESHFPTLKKEASSNNEKPQEEKAEGFISVHDFPNMAYLLQQPKGQNLFTNVYASYQSSLNRFLNAIEEKRITPDDFSEATLQEYKIARSWIPKQILKYLENVSYSLSTQITKKLNDMLFESLYLLQALDSKDLKDLQKQESFTDKQGNTYFRKQHQNIIDLFKGFRFKNGELATWLAKDIVRLTPPKTVITEHLDTTNYKKINGTQFQILQAQLAYFLTYQKELPNLFKEFEITESEKPHPFLHKVSMEAVTLRNGKKGAIGISKFVKRYLYRRIGWLQYQKKQVNNTAQLKYTNWYYLPIKQHLYNSKSTTVNNYLTNFKKMPLYLPRGVFNSKIKEVNSLENQNVNLSYILLNKEVNFQWFYKEHYTTEGLSTREKADFDQKVRYQKMKDVLMWNMVKELAKDSDFEEVLSTKSLANIVVDEELSLLKSEAKMSLKRKSENGTEFTIVADRKIKDYGNLKRFLKDKRIPNLLEYYTQQDSREHTVERIEKELQLYEQYRLECIEKAFLLEESFLKENPNFVFKTEDHRFREILEHIRDTKQLEANIIEDLILYRNKLLHNNVPLGIPVVVESVDDYIIPKLCKYILNSYTNCMKEIFGVSMV
jgi:hypothetical protein